MTEEPLVHARSWIANNTVVRSSFAAMELVRDGCRGILGDVSLTALEYHDTPVVVGLSRSEGIFGPEYRATAYSALVLKEQTRAEVIEEIERISESEEWRCPSGHAGYDKGGFGCVRCAQLMAVYSLIDQLKTPTTQKSTT